jgi:hypothetical protein
MDKRMISLCFSFIFIWLFIGMGKSFAAGESVSLATYYPSPLGNYNEIDVYNKTTANQSMVLSPTGSLATTTSQSTVPGTGVKTSIDANGDVTTSKLTFSSPSTLYTREFRGKDIVTPSLVDGTGLSGIWKIPDWQVKPWSAIQGAFGIFPSIVPQGYDCSQNKTVPAFLNSVYNESGLFPVCIAVPLGGAFYLAICTGSETIRMKFQCIEKM